MSLDAESRERAETQSQQPAAEEQPPQRKSALARWLRRIVVTMAIVAVPIIRLLPHTVSSDDAASKLTHVVQRGDLRVTVLERGIVESAENTEIKCKVRGDNTVTWVVESGTMVRAGDELLRLDTLFIDEQINERSKYAHWSRSGAENSKGRLARSKLAIAEYEEGRFVADVMTKEKDLAIAESSLLTAQAMLDHAKMMSERGYVSDLEVEEKEFRVTQAGLELEVKQTELNVLKKYTKAEQSETLKGNLAAVKALHEANAERAIADASRRDRAVEESKYCIVRAPRDGMVIHPSAARWRNAPEVAEGATVYKNQVLLLMPDLSKMQVKVGVNESVVDRVKDGQTASVSLPDQSLGGKVTSVASVTRPAGWWNGNAVDYDTIVRIPAGPGVRPGMSAEVEILIASYTDVLKIPVAAIVKTAEGSFCWVKTPAGIERRELTLGDSNDVFTIAEAGLQEGDEVLLNPLNELEEAQSEAKQQGRYQHEAPASESVSE